jgi:ribonuclease BN (tRNA processing enzyme)
VSSLTLLGTGTCQIEHERRASSVLLELDGTHILFDCGHGIVQRLLEVGVEHNQLQHIVFSHFHADHISDIIPFLQAGAFSRRNPRTSDVHIYGPAGVHAIIDGFRCSVLLLCNDQPMRSLCTKFRLAHAR